VCEHVLQEWATAKIAAYSRSHACWVEQKSDIYDFSSLGRIQSACPVVNLVSGLSATCFKLPSDFHGGPTTFDIFRLVDGQGIGIHNDATIDVYRLALTISRTRTLSEGGAFILMGEQTSDVAIYPASQNAGVLFRTRPVHRHAVSVVKGHVLLLLVLQFERRPKTRTVEDPDSI
jgi:hypothetical protein